MRAPSTSSRARCLAESPGVPSARSSAAKDSSAEPDMIRHCVSVQCRSTIRSGSAAWPSARSATRSAAARSPVRYSASARRPASQPWVADPAGMLSTARASSSAATPGAWPTRESADAASQSIIQSGPSSAGPRSSCRATRSGGTPAAARACPASRCQTARTEVGISAYSASLISGWRKARPLTESVRTPVERASSSAGTRSVTVRPSTAVRSVIANSTPSSAAARSTSLVGAETNPSRSAMTPGSESGTEPAASWRCRPGRP